MKVLIVEDIAVLADVAVAFFKEVQGWNEVHTAGSVTEATDKDRDNGPYFLYVVDQGLGHGFGSDFVRHVRARHGAGPFIIANSAQYDGQSELMKAGANIKISKFDVNDLVIAVRGFLL